MANEYDIQKMINESVERTIKPAIEMLTKTFEGIHNQLENITKNQEKMSGNISSYSTTLAEIKVEVVHLKNNKDDLYTKNKTVLEKIGEIETNVTQLKTGIGTIKFVGGALVTTIFLVIGIIEFLQK